MDNIVSNTITEFDILSNINTNLGYICAFLIFFVVVLLCYFVYKFFDMFFKI